MFEIKWAKGVEDDLIPRNVKIYPKEVFGLQHCQHLKCELRWEKGTEDLM